MYFLSFPSLLSPFGVATYGLRSVTAVRPRHSAELSSAPSITRSYNFRQPITYPTLRWFSTSFGFTLLVDPQPPVNEA
ncbi:uncharacterized protein EDB91DRAFT_597501 [Suillus paluster]|uniref:uncharacterized protein n=1 Tax=Suillus paluster TaxID=48578 RepID=UPI001B87A9D6|nr:uncharacterized protein EDB91DRAFT_597501 [Suillus paluster]KAG1751278.1 hypothetical protein EDB91DRAFT_597501 [Suillus paluster]